MLTKQRDGLDLGLFLDSSLRVATLEFHIVGDTAHHAGGELVFPLLREIKNATRSAFHDGSLVETLKPRSNRRGKREFVAMIDELCLESFGAIGIAAQCARPLAEDIGMVCTRNSDGKQALFVFGVARTDGRGTTVFIFSRLSLARVETACQSLPSHSAWAVITSEAGLGMQDGEEGFSHIHVPGSRSRHVPSGARSCE